MTAADIVTILGGVGAPLLLIGGGVRWIVSRVDRLDDRLKKEERRSIRLEREYGRVVLQVQRWRTAFQIVAAELTRIAPDNNMLHVATQMMAEKVPDGIPDAEQDEEDELLHKLTQGPNE